ncbi:MAG: DoxX family protein, partial [Bdellovibrionales bacterium]|nr:DoxX family protein [Bdellovibrionales bacterium]
LKEWAYAGFAFDFLGATASHALAGDSANALFPLLFFTALISSYLLWYKSSATPLP